MNILMVSSYLPYPLIDGGSVRLYNIIKELAQKHKITLICEIRSHQSQTDIDEMKKLCEEVLVVAHRKPWSFEHVSKTLLSTCPLLMTMHTFPQMKQHIVEALNSKHYDVIHVETFYVYQNLPKTYLPTVLIEHNIEYQVYGKFANKSLAFLRPLFFTDIAKIKYWEELFWKKATKVVAVSEKEQKEMKGIQAALVPNGVDLEKFTMKSEKAKSKRKERRVLFIGSFKWIQNQQAAMKILSNIWPLVLSRMTDNELRDNLKLWIVGKNIPETIKSYASKQILIDENAPSETEKIYQASDILLAPIEVGGGSSYKILEAMASGIPVVTSHLGIEGINAVAGKHALVGATDEEFAKAVVDLLTESSSRQALVDDARSFVEKTYNWQVIAEELENVYKEAIEIGA